MLIPETAAVGEMAESAPTVPEATYNLRVEKAEYVPVPKSKDAKGPYIKVQFGITGPAAAEKSLGRKIFENFSTTGDGTWRLREFLTVTGHPADFKLVDDAQLVGLECGGAVVVEKGTGGYQDKNRVKKYIPMV